MDGMNWRSSFQSQEKRYYEELHKQRAKGLSISYYVDGRAKLVRDMGEPEIRLAARELARRHTERAINKHNESQAAQKLRKGYAA